MRPTRKQAENGLRQVSRINPKKNIMPYPVEHTIVNPYDRFEYAKLFKAEPNSQWTLSLPERFDIPKIHLRNSEVAIGFAHGVFCLDAQQKEAEVEPS